MNLRSGPVDSSTVVDTIADAAVAEVGNGDAALVRTFVRRYLAETDPYELGWRTPQEVGQILAAHWRLGAGRRTPIVLSIRPVGHVVADGTGGPHGAPATVLLAVMDDVPFLVDSIHAVLTRYGLGIHLTIHPDARHPPRCRRQRDRRRRARRGGRGVDDDGVRSV